MVATEELLSGLTISADAKNKIREAIAADNAPSAFDALRYDHCSSEAWLKDNIAHTLPALLLMQGFRVDVLEHDDEMSTAGFVADAQGRKAVKRDRYQASQSSTGQVGGCPGGARRWLKRRD